MAMWNAVQKYYCAGDFEERIYDEPNTADTWWNVDVSLISVAVLCLFLFPSLSFLIVRSSPILTFRSISGSIRAWLHGV